MEAKQEEEKVTLLKSDFETDQEVRWCPGCGDYSILAAVQKLLPKLNRPVEQYAFISGIGCSSRFPYYMNTYGFHTIHGRAPAISTGVKIANPDLSVWMITGDGDALSIGGNHILHLLRRNVDINVLLFNNQIYGLTKGQYSPTSEIGKVTKSTPFGSADYPVNPILFALGSEATFVARSLAVDAKHLIDTMNKGDQHRGTSFIEIYQNCNIFNDGAFDYMAERKVRADRQVQLTDGELLIFGKDKDKGIALDGLSPKIVTFEAGNEAAAEEAGVIRYDVTNHALATIMARLDKSVFPAPVGIFYQVKRDMLDRAVNQQVQDAQKNVDPSSTTDERLNKLMSSGDTWVVS